MSRKEISESIKVYIRQRPDFHAAGGAIEKENADENRGSAIDSSSSSSSDRNSSTGIQNVSEDGRKCTYYSSANKVSQTFTFDRYFQPDTDQETVFETIARPIVDSALLGYSGTILAYGPTGSGKTFTMRGLASDLPFASVSVVEDEKPVQPAFVQRGIMPRCIEHLLQSQQSMNKDSHSTCEIWASYLQIYCESLTDLLADDPSANYDPQYPTQQQAPSLAIREKAAVDGEGATIYVEGLSRFRLQTMEDLETLLRRGDARRSTAATNMNEFSSRSHAVLMIKLILKEQQQLLEGDANLPYNGSSNTSSSGNGSRGQEGEGEGGSMQTGGNPGTYRESTLMLVDLAGSERASASAGKGSTRQEEARAINLSLSALGNCMSALAERSSSSSGGGGGNNNNNTNPGTTGATTTTTTTTKHHIPYRDSKLTRLLQGCLGGSSRTAVVVTLATGTDTGGETLSALRFASRASRVKVRATVGTELSLSKYRDYEALYAEAKLKMKQLETQANNTGGVGGGSGSGSGGGSGAANNRVKELERLLREKEAAIETQAMEVTTLKKQLQAVQQQHHQLPLSPSSSSSSSAATAAAATTTGDGGVSAAIRAASASATAETEQLWSQRLEAATQEHVSALAAQHASFTYKLQKAQQAEQAALSRQNELLVELRAEKERNLTTMQSLREATDQRFEEEDVYKSRISELLDEMAALRDAAEDKDRAIAQLTQQCADSVTRAQVQEMEQLFLDTVSRLSERVQNLESSSRPSSAAAGNTGNAGSSATTNSSGGGSSSSSSRGGVRMEPGGRIRTNAANASGSSNANNSSNNSNSSSARAGVGGASGGGIRHSNSVDNVPLAQATAAATSSSSSSSSSRATGRQMPGNAERMSAGASSGSSGSSGMSACSRNTQNGSQPAATRGKLW